MNWAILTLFTIWKQWIQDLVWNCWMLWSNNFWLQLIPVNDTCYHIFNSQFVTSAKFEIFRGGRVYEKYTLCLYLSNFDLVAKLDWKISLYDVENGMFSYIQNWWYKTGTKLVQNEYKMSTKLNWLKQKEIFFFKKKPHLFLKTLYIDKLIV